MLKGWQGVSLPHVGASAARGKGVLAMWLVWPEMLCRCKIHTDFKELVGKREDDFMCLFFVGVGFELRASCLQSRCSMAWVIPAAHFALIILEMGVLWTICLDRPQTTVLLMSASWVARITGLSRLIFKLLLLLFFSVLGIELSLVHGRQAFYHWAMSLAQEGHFFLCVSDTGAWTQGLNLEPLHQIYFFEGFFERRSRELLAWAGFEPLSWSLSPE
jgi:hypothetical protein